jgi:1,4-alpha-glucan branching enzyme
MKAKTAKTRTGSATEQLVHFEFSDPAARKVCIAGSFNDWHADASEMIPMGSGKWVKDLELAPGTYEYRLVIDGKWVTDTRCAHSVPNAFGETNSLLVVLEPLAKVTRNRNSSIAAARA